MDVRKSPLQASLLFALLFTSATFASETSVTGSSGKNSSFSHDNDNSLLSFDYRWENDSFLPRDLEDRHYTNGMKLSWIYNPSHKPSTWLQKGFSETLSSLFSRDYRVLGGGALGMNMYSPTNISNPNRDRDDRPYAGWLYGGMLAQAYEFSSNGDSEFGFAESLHSIEIQIGAVGRLSMQEEVQKLVHETVSATRPEGWEHQIPGRLGVEAIYLYRKNLIPSLDYSGETPKQNWLRLIPHTGFAVGNLVNYMNLGATVVIGNSFGEFPYLGIQPTAVPELSGTSPNSTELRFPDNPRLYGYFGIDFRYYASNLFIEGAGSAKHDIDLENVVYDLFFGVVYKPRSLIFKNWKFSYQIINRSKEFESQNSALEKSHKIGQFGIEYSI